MNISIVGGGEWGLALADVLANNSNKVIVFDRNPAKVELINKKHTILEYNSLTINKEIIATNNIDDLFLKPDYIIIATPSFAVIDIFKIINLKLKTDAIIINIAKGFDLNNKKLLLEEMYELKSNKYIKGICSILGPGFAIEVIKKNLTCTCIVGKDQFINEEVQYLFSNDYFRAYITLDTIGAQIGTALKNAIAIGSGIIMGLGYGENTKASLITRGLHEITKFGLELGANKETFLGLTGVGDLILTCNSTESRNFRAGFQIGKDDDVNYFFKNNKMTVEGIDTIKFVYKIALEKNIDMPIIKSLYSVLFENQKPSFIVKKLMNRPLKDE